MNIYFLGLSAYHYSQSGMQSSILALIVPLLQRLHMFRHFITPGSPLTLTQMTALDAGIGGANTLGGTLAATLGTLNGGTLGTFSSFYCLQLGGDTSQVYVL